MTITTLEALVEKVEALQEQVAKLTERVDALDTRSTTFVVRTVYGFFAGDEEGVFRYSKEEAEQMRSRGVDVVEVWADTLEEVGE